MNYLQDNQNLLVFPRGEIYCKYIGEPAKLRPTVRISLIGCKTLLAKQVLNPSSVQFRIDRRPVCLDIMLGNSTISPPNLCFLGGVVRNHSLTLHTIDISTAVIIAILSPVAVVGNALVLAAIWRNPSLRTPSYILLSGLAFTDLFTGLITQPSHVASRLICLEYSHEMKTNNQPSFLSYLIAFSAGCANYFYSLTVLLVTLMSIERWLHMTRRSLLTVRRSCFVVAIISIILIPMAAVRLMNIIKQKFDVISQSVSIFILLFCIITTPTAYFKVFRIIHRHQQQVAANDSSQSAINLAKYKKSVFTILYIIALFIVSVLPLLLFVGLSVFQYNLFDLQLVFLIAVVFSYLSSSVNPLIYLWRMNDIRNGVRQLLKQLLCKDN